MQELACRNLRIDMINTTEQRIKSLLTRAWKERWSELTWGIQVKEALRQSPYSEVELVKCLLQQIFIGPTPNQLLLSYLTCLMDAGVVSHATVISIISSVTCYNKARCIICLLQLFKASYKKVQAHSEEDSISLAVSFLSAGNWLFNVAKEALTRLLDMNLHSEDHTSILTSSGVLLQELLLWEFSNVMLVLSKWHDQNLHESLLQAIKSLRDIMNQCNSIDGASQDFRDCLESLKNVSVEWENLNKPVAIPKPWNETINSGIHVLVTMEALKNHSLNLDEFVNRLVLLKRLKGCRMETVYSELVRASCLGLMNMSESGHELKFDVFTFLVIPTVFKRLRQLVGDPNNSNEVYSGLERCVQNSTLFDLTDLKCNCNTLETLLEEIKKRTELLDDRQVQMLLAQREPANFPKIHPVTAQGATLILRADSTVNSILKTLDADYSKTQDSLFSVLSHLLSGKSLELILSAATGTGKLPQFAARLIRFNERNSKAGSNSDGSSKTPHTRAILFDICFLMLCHMAQTYGPEIITMAGQSDSFFEQWCALNLSEEPNLEVLLSRAEQNKVDHLLTFCTSQDIDIRTSNVKWPDLCWSLPAALKETMNSWEVGALPSEEFWRMLDALRAHMCVLPVCAAAWLCNNLPLQSEAQRKRSLSVLEHLMSPMPQDDFGANEYMRERSTLMMQILRKLLDKAMQKDALILEKRTMEEIFSKMWTTVIRQEWLDHESLSDAKLVLKMARPVWFVNALVMAILTENCQQKRNNAVDIAWALMHLQIVECSIALMESVLPKIVYTGTLTEILGGPGGKALSRLLVWVMESAAVLAMEENTQGQQEAGEAPPLKFVAISLDDDNGDTKPMRVAYNHQNGSALRLLKTVVGVMKLLLRVSEEKEISPRTAFLYHFVRSLVETDFGNLRILQFLPPRLVFNVIRISPSLVSLSEALLLVGVNSAEKRRVAAHALSCLHVLKQREL